MNDYAAAVKYNVVEDDHFKIASDIPEINDYSDKDVDCDLGQVLLLSAAILALKRPPWQDFNFIKRSEMVRFVVGNLEE